MESSPDQAFLCNLNGIMQTDVRTRSRYLNLRKLLQARKSESCSGSEGKYSFAEVVRCSLGAGTISGLIFAVVERLVCCCV